MVLGKPQTDPTLEWFLSHCHIHKYPSKSTLIHQGEKAETLYYIVKGSVAVLIKDEEGKEMILSYLNQGDFIGELGLFEEGQERSAWVRAKTACEVAEISYKKFRQLIQVNPDILMRLSSQMARRLQVTSEKVGNLAFLDVTGRIAQTLLNLAKQPDAMTHPAILYPLLTLYLLIFSNGQAIASDNDSIRLSLLTCAPGEEIYSLFGHTAIRYEDPVNGIDAVFNYGLFSFNTPNFILRFSLGETDYQLGATDYAHFAAEYAFDGRSV